MRWRAWTTACGSRRLRTGDLPGAGPGLDSPELRENQGEIETAAEHSLPRLIEPSDLRGDVHMHTQATDGRNTILEMAEAGIARGYEYIAITDHSKNLAMVNGLDDQRAIEHIKQIRKIDSGWKAASAYDRD